MKSTSLNNLLDKLNKIDPEITFQEFSACVPTQRAVRPSQVTPADHLWRTLDDNPEIEEIIIRPNSKGEVKNPISCLKDGKAAGADDIVAEL